MGMSGMRSSARQAANRQNGDIACRDAIVPRRQRVAQFMQHDAPENGEDEKHAAVAVASDLPSRRFMKRIKRISRRNVA